MKKKFLFCAILATAYAFSANAQETEMITATLQHGNQTTVFYNKTAFINAYNAAADTLDVITLSSGTFSSPGVIEKSLTIYGQGFETDTITGIEPTIIDGSELPIYANGTHLEGLLINNRLNIGKSGVTSHDNSIIRCRMMGVKFNSDSYDTEITQCVIASKMDPVSGHINGGYTVWGGEKVEYTAHNLNISNCWISGGIQLFSVPESTIHVDHCILWTHYLASNIPGGSYGPYYYTNNIIYKGFDEGATSKGNKSGTAIGTLFEDEGEDGYYDAKKSLAVIAFDSLNGDEINRGTDGTVIGLYGGVYGWKKIPSIPRITKTTIDTSSANEGVIKVNIAAEINE